MFKLKTKKFENRKTTKRRDKVYAMDISNRLNVYRRMKCFGICDDRENLNQGFVKYHLEIYQDN